jgi:hypothetical protein
MTREQVTVGGTSHEAGSCDIDRSVVKQIKRKEEYQDSNQPEQ